MCGYECEQGWGWGRGRGVGEGWEGVEEEKDHAEMHTQTVLDLICQCGSLMWGPAGLLPLYYYPSRLDSPRDQRERERETYRNGAGTTISQV